MLPQLNRRRFLGYLLLSAALVRCKKDTIVGPASTKTPGLPGGSSASTTYLSQYGATEASPVVGPPAGLLKTFNGYVDQQSYLPGSKASVFISGQHKPNAEIILRDIQGNSVLSQQMNVDMQTISSAKPWVDGLKYPEAFSVELPSSLRSGIYTWADWIPMIVRGNDSAYDVTVVYNSNTLNAYNPVGGKSLYFPSFDDRATVVSYLRSQPINNQPFFKFLDSLNYNINYIADFDMDDYSELDKSKVVIVTGHNEYWTRQARENIDQFIASGRNVIMLTGNSMWWQVRYNTAKNLMICYKSDNGTASDNTSLDPLSNTNYNTVNWGTTSTDYSISQSLGAEYRYGGYGNTMANRWNGYRIVNDSSPLFQGTGLKNGDILNVPTREYDGAPVVKNYPPGSTEIPEIDNSKLNFNKIELLGFDHAQNLTLKSQLGYGTFIISQKTPTSGVVINAASNDWCTNIGTGQPGDREMQIITQNMIDCSLNGTNLFTK